MLTSEIGAASEIGLALVLAFDGAGCVFSLLSQMSDVSSCSRRLEVRKGPRVDLLALLIRPPLLPSSR
ncbi:MAG: hypothetical protein U0359_36440 [Byssovorax sp.]